MRDVRVLLVIFAFVGSFAPIQPRAWVITDDFSHARLAKLTAQQEHELLLATLSQESLSAVWYSLELELMAKSIGNDFYGCPAEQESANRENHAIVKAMVECESKVRHARKIVLLSLSMFKAADLVTQSKDLCKGFSYFCSKLDENLEGDSCWTAAKERYKSQNLSSPKKTYFYGIPKSDDDLLKAIAELLNEPQVKKIVAIQSFGVNKYVSTSILELANLPGKEELVQKIFEKSIESAATHVKEYRPNEIDKDILPERIFNQNHSITLGPILFETLLSNINEYPHLKTDFQPIRKRYLDGIQSETDEEVPVEVVAFFKN